MEDKLEEFRKDLKEELQKRKANEEIFKKLDQEMIDLGLKKPPEEIIG